MAERLLHHLLGSINRIETSLELLLRQIVALLSATSARLLFPVQLLRSPPWQPYFQG